jgi:tetratricopeptide (TPR) repeat protein
MNIKRVVSSLILAGVAAVSALGQELTQAELEKMVGELDAVGVRNDRYIYPIKCSVVESDDVNAYASIDKMPKEGEKPQSVMVVYSGLVKFAKGDRRLIRAVVAHEVAHLMQGHVLAPRFVAQDLAHLWTRQQEMDADLTGSKLLERAGYSKKDMIDMLAMLDKLEADSGWIWRLSKNDHTSAKNRAAEVAGNTDVMKSMMCFEKGLAFMECRNYSNAANMFERATKLEPKFVDAFVNAAQAGLMNYYDNLPAAIQEKWFIPDFGPTLTDNPIGGREPEIREEDKARFRKAQQLIAAAKAKAPTNARVLEFELLAKALDPDATPTTLVAVGDKLGASTSTGEVVDRIRFANNAAVAYHRGGNIQKAYDIVIQTLKSTRSFSNYLAQNLGRFNVPNRSKDDELLVLDVMVQWLNDSPTSNPYYQIVKDNYTKGCTKAGVQAKETKPKPTYLCNAVSIHFQGKEAPILFDTSDYVDGFGAPTQKITIAEQYPDVQYWIWNNGELGILTERGQVVRVTSQATGAYVDLKPSDESVNVSYRIIVGMTEAAFNDILDLSKAVEKKVSGVTGIETWKFFPNLLLGVQVKDGRIAGITVAPVPAK